MSTLTEHGERIHQLDNCVTRLSVGDGMIERT